MMKKRKEAPSSLGPDGKLSPDIRWRKDGSIHSTPGVGRQFEQLGRSPKGAAYDGGSGPAKLRRVNRVAKLENLAAPRRPQGSTNWAWKPLRERQDQADAKALAVRVAARARRRQAEKTLCDLREAGATDRQLEAFRLTQIDRLTQRAAAARMGIAQQNVAKLLKKLTS